MLLRRAAGGWQCEQGQATCPCPQARKHPFEQVMDTTQPCHMPQPQPQPCHMPQPQRSSCYSGCHDCWAPTRLTEACDAAPLHGPMLCMPLPRRSPPICRHNGRRARGCTCDTCLYLWQTHCAATASSAAACQRRVNDRPPQGSRRAPEGYGTGPVAPCRATAAPCQRQQAPTGTPSLPGGARALHPKQGQQQHHHCHPRPPTPSVVAAGLGMNGGRFHSSASQPLEGKVPAGAQRHHTHTSQPHKL